MSIKQLYFVVFVLFIGCQQLIAAETTAPIPNEKPAKDPTTRQLEINKDALLNGAEEKIRIDSASILLIDTNPAARKILLDALKDNKNPAAQTAICKSLIDTAKQKDAAKIKDVQDFIQPLLNIAISGNPATSKPAAEATLLFDYEQISNPLDAIFADETLPVATRANAIQILKLRPDKRAIFKLMDLLDTKEAQLFAQAEAALKSLGMPVGENERVRKEIRRELKRKSKETFLIDWEIRRQQQEQMKQLHQEMLWWQKQYLNNLEKIYQLGDDTSRVNILVESLSSPKTVIKLWALEKVEQRRKGTKTELPAKLGPALIGLVSDANRDVRLKTAGLLALMVELNSAEKLLGQLKAEKDDEVKMELLIALAAACDYAFLPNSAFKIPPQIKNQALEIALSYLIDKNTQKAQTGAETIKKLLKHNGTSNEDMDRYLDALAGRYKLATDNSNVKLRGELNNVMADLCAESVCKTKASEKFKGFFEQGLTDTSDFVRQASVEGLIYIDKAAALTRFRKDPALLNDKNANIRAKLMTLAQEAGDKEDLGWLAERFTKESDIEPAWQTMLKIFQLKSSDAALLKDWLARFSSPTSKLKLSNEQMLSFLQIAKRRAVSEKNAELLKAVQRKFVDVYKQTGDFKKAAEYLGQMRDAATEEIEKRAITAELLSVHLQGGNTEASIHLIENQLLIEDIDANSAIVKSIDNYLISPANTTDPNAALLKITAIKPANPRPKWLQQVAKWVQRLSKTKKEEPPPPPAPAPEAKK